MRQILIIDKNFDKYMSWRFSNEELLSIDFTTASDIEKAFTVISTLPELDLILINPLQVEHDDCNAIEDYLVEEKLTIPVCFLSSFPKKRRESFELDCELESEEFFTLLKNQFLSNDSKKNNKLTPPYVHVDFQFLKLHPGARFPIDFYLRIKKNSEEHHYIKRLFANDTFGQAEIKNFTKHGVTHLYVLKKDYKKFLEISLKLTYDLIHNSEKKTIEKSYDYYLVKEIINLVGIDEETQMVVQQNISNMENTVRKNELLTNYIELLKENPNSYGYVHSMLIAMILTKVTTQFDWDSKMIKEKIVYIAFFHDIAILDDKLTRVHSDEQLYYELPEEQEVPGGVFSKKRFFKKYEIEQVQNHALNSAFIIEKFEDIPMGVYQVIKEHHGVRNGIGFTDHLSLSLQPLSMMFMVVEEFFSVFLDMEAPTRELVKSLLAELDVKYSKGNYKKTVEALLKISN